MKLLFEGIRDYLAGQDERVNRDEFILIDLANLLMCKLLDERENQDDPDAVLAFQMQVPPEQTGTHIRDLFASIQAENAALFPEEGQTIEVTDKSITYIVQKLQRYRILQQDRHSVGDAFQVLRSKAVKGADGQFFTPGPVVQAAVRIMNPTERDKVIDPAGGTGGFAALVRDHVYSTIEASGQRVDVRKLEWVKRKLYVIDKDTVSVRFCKSYLTLMNDGGHVFQADAVRTSSWMSRRDDIAREVQNGTIDKILTNPPFGENLILSTPDGRQEHYQFSHRWRKNPETNEWQPIADQWQDRQLGLIFLERCFQLLKNGGKLGIVLPETFLFSREFEWLVEYLTRKYTIDYIINLPMVTFEEFCRAKTCLVFLTNRQPLPEHTITFSYPESIGFDKHGNIRFKVLDNGEQSSEPDDELTEAIDMLTQHNPPEDITKYNIPVLQCEAREKKILLPQYYWRKPITDAFDEYCINHNCDRITLGELVDQGYVTTHSGHGSPNGRFHGKGPIPYVKVSDIKNWRIIENPSYCIPESLAINMWGRNGPDLTPYELISPSRASRNIGMWAVIMPWQTRLLLTKEFLRLRVIPCGRDGLLANLDWAFLLYAMSLKVVRDQYQYLVFMQTNREDLGDRWKEVRIPLPRSGLKTWGAPVRKYFEALVTAKTSRDTFMPEAGHDLADWPS